MTLYGISSSSSAICTLWPLGVAQVQRSIIAHPPAVCVFPRPQARAILGSCGWGWNSGVWHCWSSELTIYGGRCTFAILEGKHGNELQRRRSESEIVRTAKSGDGRRGY